MKNFDCSTVDKPTPDLRSSEVTRNTLTNEKAFHDYQQRQRKRSNYLMKCFRTVYGPKTLQKVLTDWAVGCADRIYGNVVLTAQGPVTYIKTLRTSLGPILTVLLKEGLALRARANWRCPFKVFVKREQTFGKVNSLFLDALSWTLLSFSLFLCLCRRMPLTPRSLLQTMKTVI